MAQHAAGFGVGLRRLELERRTVEFFRHRRGYGKGGRQPVGAGCHGHAAFQELAAPAPRTDAIWAGHDISPLWLFSRLSTARSNCLAPRQNMTEPVGVTVEMRVPVKPCRARTYPPGPCRRRQKRLAR